MSEMSGESPTVVKLKNEISNLKRTLDEAKDIVLILSDQHVIKHDDKFRGPYAPRINKLLGL